MRLRPRRRAAPDLDSLDLLRLRRAQRLDAMPDAASDPAVPGGGLVRALADELGVTVEALLEWGAAQGDAELAAPFGVRSS